jgi:hypothetical protein
MAEAKLGRCPRCKAYGLVADVQGVRIALDIAPVDAAGFGLAVASAAPLALLYWVKNEPGRPLRLLGGYFGSPRPSWGPGGSQTGTQRLHAEHSCGAPARDMVIVPVQRPLSAPVPPGSRRGGPHPPDVPAGATQAQEPRSRATSATPRRSRALRCQTCRKLIDRTQPHFAIEHETLACGWHEECE